jgi:hypothetical protein
MDLQPGRLVEATIVFYSYLLILIYSLIGGLDLLPDVVAALIGRNAVVLRKAPVTSSRCHGGRGRATVAAKIY